jgi:SWI/SNF-related matrix-associated actin-dependent regulator 1 of chromatin subfamily A
VRVLTRPPREKLDGVTIIGWPQVAEPRCAPRCCSRSSTASFLDESHYAKSFDAKRTCAVYGDLDAGGACSC